MKLVALFALMILPATTAYPQDELDGIFVTASNKNCGQELVTFQKEKICIASKPIIPITDFAYITDLKTDLNQTLYFNLVFTPPGYDKIKKLSSGLPNAQFVLVVKKQVIGWVKNIDLLNTRVLKIGAGVGSNAELQLVHETLATVLPVKGG